MNDFLHSPYVIVVPNAYLNQLTNSEDKMKSRNTYGLVQKDCGALFHLHLQDGKMQR